MKASRRAVSGAARSGGPSALRTVAIAVGTAVIAVVFLGHDVTSIVRPDSR